MHKYHEIDSRCVLPLFRNRNKSVAYQCILFQLKFQTQKDPKTRSCHTEMERWLFPKDRIHVLLHRHIQSYQPVYSVTSLLQPPSSGNAKAQPRAFIACARAVSGCGRLCRALPRAASPPC